MAILSNILGLDLGSHSLKAVELRQTLRGFEAVALRILPRANSETPFAELVRHFIRMHRLSTQHVVCALPGDRLSARPLSFPFRDRKKITRAVPFAVEGDSLFDLEQVLVDWEIVSSDRSHADVVATIATRTDVSQLLETLQEAGCEPRTLEAEGLVLSNLSVLFDLSGTRVIIDLGHLKTTCCLVSDGRPVAARTFSVGGAALTQALAQDRSLALEEAERAKCETGLFGTTLSEVSAEVGTVLDRVAREIVRTLGSWETVIGSLDSGPVSQLMLCGGTAELHRLDEFLTQATGITAGPLGPPREGRGGSLVAGRSPLAFAPAIALALRGTAAARTRMDFRQNEFAVRVDLGRYRRDLAGPLGLSAAALLLFITSIGTATVLEGRRAGRVEEQIGHLYSEALPGRNIPENAMASLREEVRAASERAEFLGVYRGNLSALDLLTEISRRIPEDLDILFEELNIDRQVIRMRVYSKSFEAADRLRSELGKFSPFASARIGSIETDAKRGGKRFDVTISLASKEGA